MKKDQKVADYALTPEELTLISKGMDKTIVPSGKHVISKGIIDCACRLTSAGAKEHRMYIIDSGLCMLQNNNQNYGHLPAGEVIGEASLLSEDSASTFDVIAIEETQVSWVEAYYLNILFQYKPELAGKYYRYLASILCKKLHSLEYF